MNENEATALFRQAADIYKDGDHKDALKIFDRLDAAFPNNVRIMYPRARTLAKLGRKGEAVALCDALIAQFGYAPAAGLKAQLQPGIGDVGVAPPVLEDTAFDPLDLNLDEGLPSAFDRPPVAAQGRQLPSPLVVGGIVVGIIVVFFGVYGIFAGKDDAGGDGTGSSVAASSTGTESPAASMPPIDTSGDPELVTVNSSNSSDGVTVNASVEYGVWTNCGGYDAFLAKYAACEPAAIRMTTMGMFVIEYRVLGEKDGVCQIEMRAVQMAIYDDWTGKAMTCSCDNSIDFIKLTEQLGPLSIMDGTLNCDGPLFDAMMATFSEYQQQ